MSPTLTRTAPAAGALAGLLASALVAATTAALDTPSAVPALLLVLAVVGATVLGGRAAGFLTAAAGTAALPFALPPFGTPRISLAEDVVALVVFGLVAFLVSALVTTRVGVLEDVDVQRRAMVRAVSHDLRTPLAAIRAVATDLRHDAGAYDEATRGALLDLLIAEAERLDHLVGGLLSVSRIDAGTLRFEPRPLDLREVVGAATQSLRVVHGDGALAIDLGGDLTVLADRVLVEQAVFNLLDNALRHTPPGTTVRVSSTDGHDDRGRPVVRLTVSDDGPGLPHELVRDLQRRRRASTRAGVGLAICEEVARVHGDHLRVDERADGTRLTLTLRRA